MSKDYRGYVTQTGLNYESSAHALGKPVSIMKIGIGSGILADNQSPIGLTAMVNKIAEFPAKVYIDDKNPGVFVAECAIPADHAINGSGYTINEMSAILDNGIMYSYRRVSGDFKPLITSGEAKSYLYRLRFIPQNASLVSVTIDPTAVWATQDDLSRSIREHEASSDPHTQYAPKASPAFTGIPTAPTTAKTDNTTKLATTAFVKTVAADYAPLNNPALTGKPTTPTPTASANDTSIANAAFVKSAITNLRLGNSATKNVGTAAGSVAAGDDARIVGAAPKASPT
ncbi:MAG: phage tail protein, partial [Plesiomonas sp.]